MSIIMPRATVGTLIADTFAVVFVGCPVFEVLFLMGSDDASDIFHSRSDFDQISFGYTVLIQNNAIVKLITCGEIYFPWVGSYFIC